ncbi:MAG: hypothetical protein LKF58_02490 [Bacilli bacterium]|jgi:hypothetical protein|nr:hypothetical protein [Bacilli bacterium]MCH4210632.1 hypothetical protein [Bacilli bacterium]MCI2055080.1 hypothetical protein [Bacilli bacterium]
MEETTTFDVCFQENSIKDRITTLNALYRSSLIELGYSPDEHLENLDSWRLFHFRDDAAAVLLTRVVDFYEGLSSMEKKVFYTDVLEKGRHYHWWWMEFLGNKEYTKTCVSTFNKILNYF